MSFRCAVPNRQRSAFPPRPESGGFRSGFALPASLSLAPQNHRTQSAPGYWHVPQPESHFVPLPRPHAPATCQCLRFARVALLRLRTGRTLHSAAFRLSDMIDAPPAILLEVFPNPFLRVPNLSPSTACFHRGPGAVPPEGDLRWPPCSAGFFRAGREAENAQQQKKRL